MTAAETLFISIGNDIKTAKKSQLFGKPCFKVNKKAFVCFFQDEMVFKLTGDVHAEALNIPGAKLFDPSGKKRPMKEWVQVPFDHSNQWANFANEALVYVNSK